MSYRSSGGSSDVSNRTVLLVLVLVMVVSVVSLAISAMSVKKAGEVAAAVKESADTASKVPPRKSEGEATSPAAPASASAKVMVEVVPRPEGA